jgi:RimJ/RimL family protein N-acetyltransferase
MMNTALAPSRPQPALPAVGPPFAWPDLSPRLVGSRVHLRELDPADAPLLRELITVPDVWRFISPPPRTAEQMARFIEWGRGERRAGRYAGFAVVPHGHEGVAGLLQLRQLQDGFACAEWGIVLGVPFWGAGLFGDAARLLLEFAFTTVGVRRLEARAAVPNARANAAMQKLGCVREGVLRQSLATADGRRHDQVLWSLLREDWAARTAAPSRPRLH